MEFHVNAKELADALKLIKPVIEKRSCTYALEWVRLEVLEGGCLSIVGTDLSTYVSTTIPIDSTGSTGSICISFQDLWNCAKNSADACLHMTTIPDDGTVLIHTENSKQSLHTEDSVDYPAFPNWDPSRSPPVSVSAHKLLNLIDQVAYVKPPDAYRFQNVFWRATPGGNLQMAAMDGHRAASSETVMPDGLGSLMPDTGLAVPHKSLKALRPLLIIAAKQDKPIEMGIDCPMSLCVANPLPAYVMFRTESTIITIKLDQNGTQGPSFFRKVVISGIESLGSVDKHAMGIDRQALIDAIKRLGPTPKEKLGVKCRFETGQELHLSSENDGKSSSSSVPIEFIGEPIEIGINREYLLEALKSVEVPSVKIGMVDPFSPVILSSDDEPGWQAVIMPMK